MFLMEALSACCVMCRFLLALARELCLATSRNEESCSSLMDSPFPAGHQRFGKRNYSPRKRRAFSSMRYGSRSALTPQERQCRSASAMEMMGAAEAKIILS